MKFEFLNKEGVTKHQNERDGSRRTNESRSKDSEIVELASRHHTDRLFWNQIMRIYQRGCDWYHNLLPFINKYLITVPANSTSART